jgi:hypothetical protein
MERNISFIVNRMNERVIAGQSIETLLAVADVRPDGHHAGTLQDRRRTADHHGACLRPAAGRSGRFHRDRGRVPCRLHRHRRRDRGDHGLLALPTMLRNNYSPELATGVIAASGTLGQIIPPSIVIVLLGTLVGDLYATGQETRAQLAGCSDALTYLGEPAVLSVGTLFQAALLPGIFAH